MQNVNFPQSDSTLQHTCISQKEGDWIIWTCPDCKDYERRLNIRTGEMRSTSTIYHPPHTGMHLPVGISPEMGNLLN